MRFISISQKEKKSDPFMVTISLDSNEIAVLQHFTDADALILAGQALRAVGFKEPSTVEDWKVIQIVHKDRKTMTTLEVEYT